MPITEVLQDRCTPTEPVAFDASTPMLTISPSLQGLTFVYRAKLAGVPVTVVMDTGSVRSYVSTTVVNHARLATSSAEPFLAVMGNNQPVHVHRQVKAKLQIKQLSANVTLHPLPHLLKGVDVLLGDDMLKKIGANLDVPSAIATLTHNGVTLQLRPTQCLANCSVATAPQPTGTPAIITAKQANKAMKQGCHTTLMLLQRDDAQSDTDNMVPLLTSSHLPSASHSEPLHSTPDYKSIAQTEYPQVFEPIPAGLPPDMGIDHVIKTTPGHQPPYRKAYRMTPQEKAESYKQIQELLAKGWIEPSGSPYGAPILFVTKKDGSLRMCIDYRQLNKLTLRDRYPLPRIDDLLDQLSKATVFSSLDLQSGYHQIRINDADVEKTAFLTPHGQFQFRVLCFGLTNAPATFQRVMNKIFAPFLGKFVLVYLDDILVYSRTHEEHLTHLRQVLSLLAKHRLYAKLSKCDFGRPSLKFLGHIVSANGVAVDPDKVRVLREWPLPRNLHQLRGFLGLANYFRKFVHNFSTIAAPLTALTSDKVQYPWHEWRQPELNAFNAIKQALTEAPVLTLPDESNLNYTVQADASDLGLGAVLLQQDKPIAYYSRKLSPAELNYTTGEKEMLALVSALKEWRCYLEGANVTLLTDHHPLTYFQDQDVLSRRQARWMEYLSRFNFVITYQKGANNIADPLSRHPSFACGVMTRSAVRKQSASSSGGGGTASVSAAVEHGQPVPTHTSSTYEVETSQPSSHIQGSRKRKAQLDGDTDSSPSDTNNKRLVLPDLADALRDAYAAQPDFTDPEYLRGFEQDEDGLWWFRRKIVVPDDSQLRTRIISEHHDPPSFGHGGIHKTYEAVFIQYWWPSMRRDIKQYVLSCDKCQRNKADSQAKAGLLQPLPIPSHRWGSVTMDMIVKLPTTKAGYNAVLVFVDRLTKYAHFVATHESLSAKGFARKFIDTIYVNHGMPSTLISDRGAQWNNRFWAAVSKILGAQVCLSSSHHPETDGQTERMNRVLEDMLRNYIRPHQKNWDKLLPLAQFAVNNSWQASIQNTPFYLNTGSHPVTPSTINLSRVNPAADSFAEELQEALKRARSCMEAAQQRQRDLANRSRRDVTYTQGDLVLLKAKHIAFKAPGAKKLHPKYVGPFPVIRMIGKVACQLQLPTHGNWNKLHNVFHVSLLKKYIARPGEDAITYPGELRLEGDVPVFEVEAILDHRDKADKRASAHSDSATSAPSRRTTHYLVRWKGWPPEHDTWEPVKNMTGAADLINAYHAKRAYEPP